VVLHHKLINQNTKTQFQHFLDNLTEGQGILTIDFEENITLERGPRELGQSWYTWERRTVFGMALLKREADGEISKWHFNLVSDCLTHDAIFVKMALSQLFASKVWQSFVQAACLLFDYPEWAERGAGIDCRDYVTCCLTWFAFLL
jgi:hypothetical protein